MAFQSCCNALCRSRIDAGGPKPSGKGTVSSGPEWVKKGPRQAAYRALLAAAVSDDGHYLAVGGGDWRVHVWDARSNEYIQVRLDLPDSIPEAALDCALTCLSPAQQGPHPIGREWHPLAALYIPVAASSKWRVHVCDARSNEQLDLPGPNASFCQLDEPLARAQVAQGVASEACVHAETLRRLTGSTFVSWSRGTCPSSALIHS